MLAAFMRHILGLPAYHNNVIALHATSTALIAVQIINATLILSSLYFFKNDPARFTFGYLASAFTLKKAGILFNSFAQEHHKPVVGVAFHGKAAFFNKLLNGVVMNPQDFACFIDFHEFFSNFFRVIV